MLTYLNSSFLSAFILGASLGMTACAVSCLPFIGTLVFGRAGERGEVIRDTIAFLGGRLVAYSFLGGFAGWLGAAFVEKLAHGLGNFVIGLSACVSAVLLIKETKSKLCKNIKANHAFSPFFLGLALTLIPCAPLASLLAVAASEREITSGLLTGFCFGIGALITPMLILIPACGRLAAYLQVEQIWLSDVIRIGAAFTLFVIGYQRMSLFSFNIAMLVSVFLFFYMGFLLRRKLFSAFFRKKQKKVFFLSQLKK